MNLLNCSLFQRIEIVLLFAWFLQPTGLCYLHLNIHILIVFLGNHRVGVTDALSFCSTQQVGMLDIWFLLGHFIKHVLDMGMIHNS